MTSCDEPTYVTCNRATWDERVAVHAASPDYAVTRFRDDPAFLSDVVRFDWPDQTLLVERSHVEWPEAQVWTDEGTYVETDVQFEHITTHEWNHSIGETLTRCLTQA